MKVKKRRVEWFLISFFLISGYLNTILRLSPEGDWTLFRILIPFAYFYLFWKHFKSAWFCTGTILLFLLYGTLTSVLLSRYGGFSAVHFLHYSTLIFLLFFTSSVIKKFGEISLYQHLRSIYVLMMCLSLFQFVTEFEFPNTQYLGTINIFFWVDNDFAAAIAAFIPLLLMDKNRLLINWLLAVLGIVIIAYNGSRIALLALLFFMLFKLLNNFKWLGIVLSSILGISLFFVFRNYELGGDTLQGLLMEPFVRIFSLNPYGLGGSIYDRTDALIFGIIELLSTWGFGIGPGNATRMFIEVPEYSLATAQSMHNFVAQFLVEYGWLAISILIFLIVNIGKGSKVRLAWVYLATIMLASLSQSEGLFSNYYFFVSAFVGFKLIANNSLRYQRVENQQLS